MTPININKSDIIVILYSLIKFVILGVCSVAIIYGFYNIAEQITDETEKIDAVYFLKIFGIILILFAFLYVMKIYFRNAINRLKDLKNGIKYGFETKIRKKEMRAGGERAVMIPFICTSNAIFKEFQISFKEYDRINNGDKVYIEALPISKFLLNIKKI
jgi:hypothetical protein